MKFSARVIRTLCSIHIFRETSEDVFVNNSISASLVGNDPLRAYVLNRLVLTSVATTRTSAGLYKHLITYETILCSGQDLYTASDYLPRTLRDPVKGPSYAVDVTAFQDAIGTHAPRWTWLEEQVKIRDILAGHNGPNGAHSAYPGVYGTELQDFVEKVAAGQDDQMLVDRPEHALFNLAMVGGGRVFGEAHLYGKQGSFAGGSKLIRIPRLPMVITWPRYCCRRRRWDGYVLFYLLLESRSLTQERIGGFCLPLSHIYPDLNFVIRDRAPALKRGETQIWPAENPTALKAGRVKFVPHDFFEDNPVKNADVYWLRYIIHDWSDDYCVRILKAIKSAMGPRSRLLIW